MIRFVHLLDSVVIDIFAVPGHVASLLERWHCRQVTYHKTWLSYLGVGIVRRNLTISDHQHILTLSILSVRYCYFQFL